MGLSGRWHGDGNHPSAQSPRAYTWGFKPRVCRNVNQIDTTSTLFGQKLNLPLLLAPIGSLESFDPGGGATSAKAAEEFGVAHMLSSRCNPGLEEVAAAADNARIFQLYVRGDDSFEDDYARRAIDNGYFALDRKSVV